MNINASENKLQKKNSSNNKKHIYTVCDIEQQRDFYLIKFLLNTSIFHIVCLLFVIIPCFLSLMLSSSLKN